MSTYTARKRITNNMRTAMKLSKLLSLAAMLCFVAYPINSAFAQDADQVEKYYAACEKKHSREACEANLAKLCDPTHEQHAKAVLKRLCASSAPATAPKADAGAEADETEAKPEPKSNPDLMPVKDREELSALFRYSLLYYNNDWLRRYFATDAKDALRMVVDGRPGTKQQKDAQFAEFTSAFTAFGIALKSTGDKLPSTHKVMVEWLGTKSCTYDEETNKGSGGCTTHWPKVKKVYEDLRVAVKKDNDITAQADRIFKTASNISTDPNYPHVAIILTHGAIALLTPEAPEKDRPYVGMGDSGLKGLEGCILYKAAAPHCGKAVKAGPEGITVVDSGGVSKTLTPEMKKKGEAVFMVGDPSFFDYMLGKPACFVMPDGELHCGAIDGWDRNGVSINGKRFPWSELLGPDGPALKFGTKEEVEKWLAKIGSGITNAGFGVQAEVSVDRVVTPEGMNDAHVLSATIAACYAFGIPLSVCIDAGVMSTFDGNMPHYSEGTGERTTGVAGVTVTFEPRLHEYVGLEVAAKGYGGFNGTGGGHLRIAPKVYFGSKKEFSISAGPQVGGHSGPAVGTNATTPRLPDERVEGWKIGGSLLFRGTIPGTD